MEKLYIVVWKGRRSNSVRHVDSWCGHRVYYTLEKGLEYIESHKDHPFYDYGIYTTNWKHVAGKVIDR